MKGLRLMVSRINVNCANCALMARNAKSMTPRSRRDSLNFKTIGSHTNSRLKSGNVSGRTMTQDTKRHDRDFTSLILMLSILIHVH